MQHDYVLKKLSFDLHLNHNNSHVTVGGHFGSHIENMEMPINNYLMQKKIKHSSTTSIKHKNLFWYYIVSSEINQNMAVEGLNASGMSFLWTCFCCFRRPRNLLTLQIILLSHFLIWYSYVLWTFLNKEQRFASLLTVEIDGNQLCL